MTGRPREFEMHEALEAMAAVFWERGYEGTSLADILEATGLQKGSLYKAFANKQEMFEKSLQHYIERTHAEKGEILHAANSPLAGIEALLRNIAAESCSKKNDFRGCLAVRSMMDRTSHDESVVNTLANCVSSAEKGLTDLIRAGQELGEIRSDMPAKMLAESLYCFTSGMLATTRIAPTKARTDRLVKFGVEMLKAH